MIPEFPEFKKLELTDKKDIEKFTLKFPPYSDFNFVSMWSWDIKGEMRISQLYGNLVVRFADYITGKPFYSFLGNKNTNSTVEKLFSLSKDEKLDMLLKLVPEDSVLGLDTKKYNIVEDRDHFDYIYHTETLAKLHGSKLKKKLTQTEFFIKEYPKAEIRLLHLGDKKTQSDVIKLYKKWITNKIIEKLFFTFEHKELEVIKRLFIINEVAELISVGIFIDNKLVAFFINELNNSNYCLGMIAKAEVALPGIYAFLRKKNAEIIFSFGKEFMNDEQDLGIENLRNAKTQFRHHSFFKKYIISYKLAEGTFAPPTP
ncbi:MAG: phosphatidylglycerol lysyltransferase domain-containing protein [Patescibacteria group bacterium]